MPTWYDSGIIATYSLRHNSYVFALVCLERKLVTCHIPKRNFINPFRHFVTFWWIPNRNILQRWRRTLHVPLRLDVVYNADPDNNNNNPQQQHQHQPQGELLERWCIDYVAFSNPSDAPIDNNETITQLRQVCKRVVILLRTLYCLARTLPSYRVHRQIVHRQQQQQQQQQRYSQQHYPQNQPYPNLNNMNMNMNTNMGTIGFSIYAAAQYNLSGGDVNVAAADMAAAAPMEMHIPPRFVRRKFAPVPTPFGHLCFSVVYHPKPNFIQPRPTRAIAIAGAVSAATATATTNTNTDVNEEDITRGRYSTPVGMSQSGHGVNTDSRVERRPRSQSNVHEYHSQRPAMVSDYYSVEHSSPKLVPLKDTSSSSNHERRTTTIPTTSTSTSTSAPLTDENGRALSGLSLALMGQCQISSEELEGKHRPLNYNNHSNNRGGVDAVRNMNAAAAAAMAAPVSKSYDNKQYILQQHRNRGNAPSSFSQNNHEALYAQNQNGHDNNNQNKPRRRSILSSNTAYPTGSSGGEPPSMFSHNYIHPTTSTSGGYDASHRAQEYGYGYNNGYNNVRMEYKPTINPQHLIPPHGSSGSNHSMRMVSPSQVTPLGSTPPLSHNIGSLGSYNVSPIANMMHGNTSPPFQNNPVSLIPPLGVTPPNNYNNVNVNVNVSSLQNILASPPSLEVLPASPFKTAATGTTDSYLHTHRSSLSVPIPPDSYEPSNSIPIPFGGSFGSTNSSPANTDSHSLLRSLYKNNTSGNNSSSSTTMQMQMQMQMQPPVLHQQSSSFEEMPFATDTSPDASSCSIHVAGETSAASSFAHRCATASRLQMFHSSSSGGGLGGGTNTPYSWMSSSMNPNNANNSNNNNNNTGSDKEGLNQSSSMVHSDLADQLAEFRNFGASLIRSTTMTTSNVADMGAGAGGGGHSTTVTTTNTSDPHHSSSSGGGSGEMQPRSSSATSTPVA